MITLHDAARQIAGRQTLGEHDGRAGVALRGDDDDGVAAHERRDDRRHQAEQGRLVGCDHADDTGRLGGGEVEVRSRDRVARRGQRDVLVAPAGVPHRAVDGAPRPRAAPPRRRPVPPTTSCSARLAAPGFHHLGQAVEHEPAVRRGLASPARVRRPGPRRPRRGRPCASPRTTFSPPTRVGPARFAAHECAVEVELVRLADRNALVIVLGRSPTGAAGTLRRLFRDQAAGYPRTCRLQRRRAMAHAKKPFLTDVEDLARERARAASTKGAVTPTLQGRRGADDRDAAERAGDRDRLRPALHDACRRGHGHCERRRRRPSSASTPRKSRST